MVAHLLLVDPHGGGGDLLVVADHDGLRRQVLEESGLQNCLGGLVDDDDVDMSCVIRNCSAMR